MSILIDKLLRENINAPLSEELPGKWFIAKPLGIKRHLLTRIKDAWKVLIGNKAFAFHYKKDEKFDN